MEVVSAGPATALDSQTSGVSWAAIAAGAVAAAALTLMLVAFGAGLGLSAVSPWADSGVSATTFKVGSGIYLVIVAVMASSVGGYLAARLRTKWTGLHTNEVFFRDTAHGFLAWAFGTLITFGVLGAAITHIGSGAAAGVSGAATAQAAQNASPADLYVDKLFRPAASPAAGAAGVPGAQPTAGSPDTSRSEVSRLWTSSFSANNDLSAEDRAYVARVVAARTGLSQPEAEKRVNDVIVEAKAAADKARKAAAQLALWLTASMLFGAFAASLAAVEGGQLRDGTWNGRVLTPRPL
jgi:hypothetical protein